MKFEPSLWRERAWLIAPAVLFFLGNLAYFLGGRAVDSSRADALRRARTSALSRRDSAQQAIAKANADAARVETVRRAEEEFFGNRIGNLNDTIAATVAEIHRVCRSANVAPHQIGYGIAERKNVPLTEMSISFSVAGDYATLRRLLQGFENDPRWMVVRQVSLGRQGETVASGSIRLSLATYFYEGAAPSGKAAKTNVQSARLRGSAP